MRARRSHGALPLIAAWALGTAAMRSADLSTAVNNIRLIMAENLLCAAAAPCRSGAGRKRDDHDDEGTSKSGGSGPADHPVRGREPAGRIRGSRPRVRA